MKIIVLGANYYQKDLVLKAKSLGYETHTFGSGKGYTEGDKMIQAARESDYFYPISVLESEAILEICRKIKPDGILTIGCDVCVPTMNYVAEKLGLIGNGIFSALVSTNKYQMKQQFREFDVPCADFILVDEKTKKHTRDLIGKRPYEKVRFPVMVKAIDQAGKCGITKVDTSDKLEEAIEYGLKENIKAKSVLVEEFIEGKEYSAECISWNGEHTILNFTEKFNIAPHFVEIIHLQPAHLENIEAIIKKALTSLEIKHGASHTEFKVTPQGEIKIIEIGARMAAESMWDVVDASTGNDYLKMAIDICMGIKPTIKPSENNTALVNFIMNKWDYNRLEWIKQNYPNKVYREGYMEPLEEKEITKNKDRFGYYVLLCNSREEGLSLVGKDSTQ